MTFRTSFDLGPSNAITNGAPGKEHLPIMIPNDYNNYGSEPTFFVTKTSTYQQTPRNAYEVLVVLDDDIECIGLVAGSKQEARDMIVKSLVLDDPDVDLALIEIVIVRETPLRPKKELICG